MKTIANVIVAVMTFFVTASLSAEEASFGLKWGMSKGELFKNISSVISESREGDIEFIGFLRASNTPMNTEFFEAQMHRKFGLQHLTWRSKPYENDEYGSVNKKALNEKISMFVKQGSEPLGCSNIGLNARMSTSFRHFKIKSAVFCWLQNGLSMTSIALTELVGGTSVMEIESMGPKWAEIMEEAMRHMMEERSGNPSPPPFPSHLFQ